MECNTQNKQKCIPSFTDIVGALVMNDVSTFYLDGGRFVLPMRGCCPGGGGECFRGGFVLHS